MMFKRNKLDPVKESMALFNHVYSQSFAQTGQHTIAAEQATNAAASYLTALKLVKEDVRRAEL
jgi:hypothetical protein